MEHKIMLEKLIERRKRHFNFEVLLQLEKIIKKNDFKNISEECQTMFEYGENLVYAERYLEACYWLSKAFMYNSGHGIIYQIEYLNYSFEKIKEQANYIEKSGYGFDIDKSIKVFQPLGETEYCHYLKHKNGLVVKFERYGSFRHKDKLLDGYCIYVINDYPELKLLKYIIYFDMYGEVYDKGMMIEDFENIIDYFDCNLKPRWIKCKKTKEN